MNLGHFIHILPSKTSGVEATNHDSKEEDGRTFDPEVSEKTDSSCAKSTRINHFNTLMGVNVILETHECSADPVCCKNTATANDNLHSPTSNDKFTSTSSALGVKDRRTEPNLTSKSYNTFGRCTGTSVLNVEPA